METSVTVDFIRPEQKVGCSINRADTPVFLRPTGIRPADLPEIMATELDSGWLKLTTGKEECQKHVSISQKQQYCFSIGSSQKMW